MVRIRIAHKELEAPGDDSDGNAIEMSVHSEDLEEVPIDDKCLAIQTSWS